MIGDIEAAFGDLCNERHWLAWLPEIRKGKPNKTPYAAQGTAGPGRGYGKTDDASTWGTLQQAADRARGLGTRASVGLVLGEVAPDLVLFGIDLDSCLDSESLAPWAQRMLELAPSYAEISPSGGGLKIYAYASAGDARALLDRLGVAPDAYGTKRSLFGAAPGEHGEAIELYVSARYFATTGVRWAAAPPQPQRLDRKALLTLADAIRDCTEAARAPVKKSRGGTAPRVNGHDQSRSAAAFRRVAELRRIGQLARYQDMVAVLRADPALRPWVDEKGVIAGERELKRLWKATAPPVEGVRLEQFHSYLPQHKYLWGPSRELWPAASVNARLAPVALSDAAGRPVLDEDGNPVKLKATVWLDQHQAIETMTWAPGRPMILEDQIATAGGLIEHSGVNAVNLYRPWRLVPGGDSRRAARWLRHIHRIYPGLAGRHIVRYLAHRVQFPGAKINHALLLGGAQGIGKDTLLEPVKYAVGPWNFDEVSPRTIVEAQFNGYARTVVLRVSETHDLGDISRYSFYEAMKTLAAAPPDMLRINEKNLREYYVVNCCAVVLTTNYRVGGIYLPADDRRHFVAWSSCAKEDFTEQYWVDLWAWYADGGILDVAAYLARLDLGSFNAKAPPPKTAAFWDIVDSNRAPEDSELADLLDRLGNPDVVTVHRLIENSRNVHGLVDGIGLWLNDRKNRRVIPHRMEACGYVPVRNPARKTGLWVINGIRQAVYAKVTLSLRDQLKATSELTGDTGTGQ